MGVLTGIKMSTSVDSRPKTTSDDGVIKMKSGTDVSGSRIGTKAVMISGKRPAVSSTVSSTVKNIPILGSKDSAGNGNRPILVSSPVVVVVVVVVKMVGNGTISALDSTSDCSVGSKEPSGGVAMEGSGSDISGVGRRRTAMLVTSKQQQQQQK